MAKAQKTQKTENTAAPKPVQTARVIDDIGGPVAGLHAELQSRLNAVGHEAGDYEAGDYDAPQLENSEAALTQYWYIETGAQEKLVRHLSKAVGVSALICGFAATFAFA